MLKLHILAFLALYLVGFIQQSFNSPLERVAVKIEITHTHEHGTEHTHSRSEESSDTDTAQSHGEVPHSHEIYINSPTLYVNLEPNFYFLPVIDENLNYIVSSERPPVTPSLFGIFRPPIA